jgi:ribonuclease J
VALRIIPLGGLGEVGMNAMVIEEGDHRVLVDCGVMFPNDQVLGVEVAIPDLAYLREAGGIEAVLVTHGHEDHIGGLPSLLREMPVPVYGTRFTLALVRARLAEAGVDVPLREVEPRRVFEVGPFDVEPIRVTHSIPDAVGFAIETDEGIVVHTGDYKIDLTPVRGERLDLGRFAEYGRAGVVALLSDSTNAEREGWSVSEAAVADGFLRRFRDAKKRIVVALFASNVYRVQSVLDLAVEIGRKVVIAGRSLDANTRIAEDLGLLKIPPGVVVDATAAAALPPGEVLVLASGAQGEPNSALARMALGTYQAMSIEAGDMVIFSSRAIPGNEIAVGQLANRLAKRGAVVIDRGLHPIHASGHAQAEEQKVLLDAVRPEHFVPIHGEYRMLLAHARTAMRMGVPASGVIVIEDGESVVVEGGRMRLGDPVPSGRVWLDARGGRDVSALVLREREHISEQGLVMAIVVADRKTGEVLRGPDLLARGVAHFEEGGALFTAALDAAKDAVAALSPEARTMGPALEDALSRGVRRVFRPEAGRRPAVLPMAVLL